MNRYLKYFLFLFIFLSGLVAPAQNETTKWYFGMGAALDFMTNPPSLPTGNAMSSAQEGVSSIADGAGNLLFYTDGVTVWNRNNAIMTNGTGLASNWSSAQAALIIKQPGNSNIYFIFTTQSALQSPTVGLRYSTVDMNLSGGMGAVTVKNTLLYPSTTERLCATRHCNGIDIWVLSHEYPGSNFYAHLVTASGVSSTPVVSSVGFSLPGITSGQSTSKFSPSGKKIMTGLYINGYELYDFDNATGAVSNPLSLGGRNGLYVEFSPDGSKAYGNGKTDTIKQWNLCAGSPAAIKASRVDIMVTGGPGQMQLAPNNKIYVNFPNLPSALGVINAPNALGTACNYVPQSQPIAPNSASYGLPQFMSSYFLHVPSFSYNVSCLNASFTAPSSMPPGLCAEVTYSIGSLAWNFGDPASGTSNASTLINPTHTFSAPGTYTVQLIVYNPCGGPLDTLRRQVAIASIPILSNAGFSLCAGQSLTLSTSGAGSYTWSTGATSSSIVIAPPASTVISVSGTDPSGCVASASQSVIVSPSPVLSILGSRVVCDGAVNTLTATGATSYTWSNGSTAPTFTVDGSSAGVYTVTGSAAGCATTQTVMINVSASPTISIAGNGTVCAGSAVTQTASGALSYTWSQGAFSPTVSLNPQQNTTYTVYGTGSGGCVSQQTVSVSALPLPVISLTGNTITCPGSAVTQTASGALSYTWSNGVQGNTVQLSPLQTTSYTVTGTGAGGCLGGTQALITVVTMTVNSVTICSGQSATLTAMANSNDPVYTWYPSGESFASIVVTPSASAVYTLVASLPGCSVGVTATVDVSTSVPAITSFSYTSPVCAGDSISLLPLLTNGFTPNGVFSTPTMSLDALSGELYLNTLTPGTHVITYSVPAAGCYIGGSSSFNLVVVAPPVLVLSPDVVIKPGASATLAVSGGSAYTWSPTTYLSCTDCDAPVSTPAETMRYCVRSAFGSCASEACVEVILSCDTQNGYSVPNAFSPNGDGKNDQFCLQGWNSCVHDFQVMVFDRWGEKVFESTNPDFCWDGMYQGKPLAADVFVFVIKAETKTESVNKKGNITLIR